MERPGITEREKIKEMKDYLRYKKFIKNYNQVSKLFLTGVVIWYRG
jgi:hypothetical protein